MRQRVALLVVLCICVFDAARKWFRPAVVEDPAGSGIAPAAHGPLRPGGVAELADSAALLPAAAVKHALWQEASLAEQSSGRGQNATLQLFWFQAVGLYMLSCLLMVLSHHCIWPCIADVAEQCYCEVPDVNSALILTYFRIRFKEPVLEDKWNTRAAAPSDRAYLASQVAFAFMLWSSIGILLRANADCLEVSLPSLAIPFSFAALFGAYSYLSRNPEVLKGLNVQALIYWPSMVMAFFAAPALQLPPHWWSCKELRTQCLPINETVKTKTWSIGNIVVEQAALNVDCGLEGRTSIMFLFLGILWMPWIIQRLEHMYLAWIWLLGTYVCWALLYHQLFEEEEGLTYYTGDQIFYRMIWLGACVIMSTWKKYLMEKRSRLSFMRESEQRHSTEKMLGILEYMLPLHVLPLMLKEPRPPIADQVEVVSIMFVLVEDFNLLAHKMIPSELLRFLNLTFIQFDTICAEQKVTKIETVAEEYVACVGVLPDDIQESKKSGGHGELLRRLFTAATEILQLQTEMVSFKIGVHTGPIKAGVIGTKLPRYRLFGDTINFAARMMQKGEKKQMQFGEQTRDELPPDMRAKVTLIGDKDMKGKGKVTCYTFSQELAGTFYSVYPRSFLPRAQRKRHSLVDNVLQARAAFSQFEKMSTHVQEDFEDMQNFGLVSNNMKAVTSSRASMRTIEGGQDDYFTKIVESATEESSKVSELSPEERRLWLESFHKKSLVKRMSLRILFEGMIVCVLFFSQLAYIALQGDFFIEEHPVYGQYTGGTGRLLVYCCCMCLILFGALCLGYLADSSKQFLDTACFRWLLLLQRITFFVLLYVAYDALMYTDTASWRRQQGFSEDNYVPPDNQLFPFIFVMMSFRAGTLFMFGFRQSLFFIALALIMLGSPWVYTILHREDGSDEWTSIFSLISALVFLIMTVGISLQSYTYETSSQARWKAKRKVELTSKRINDILDSLMPPRVIEELRSLPPSSSPAPHKYPSHKYRHALVAQSDLAGFTALSSNKTPQEVVEFMGALFFEFDMLTDTHKVYKVETVGDAYIVAMAEGMLTALYSPVNVILMSLDMVRAVDDWATKLGIAVTCRVGVACGEVIGGIVGTDMQRYHLFGETMSIMDLLECTSIEGHVQVNEACKVEVERQLREMPKVAKMQVGENVVFEPRDVDHLETSKGEVHQFSKVGGPTFLVNSDQPLRRR